MCTIHQLNIWFLDGLMLIVTSYPRNPKRDLMQPLRHCRGTCGSGCNSRPANGFFFTRARTHGLQPQDGGKMLNKSYVLEMMFDVEL